MHQPIILSDEEDDENDISTPCQPFAKKQRPELDPPRPTVLILDDDPTPQKPIQGSGSTPSFVPETPMSALPNSEVSIVKCTVGSSSSDPQNRVSNAEKKFGGISGLICLESDNESESDCGRINKDENETQGAVLRAVAGSVQDSSSRNVDSNSSPGNINLGQMTPDSLLHLSSSQLDVHKDDTDTFLFCDYEREHYYPEKENINLEYSDNIQKHKETKANTKEKNCSDEVTGKMKMTKEERLCLLEEKKRKKEEEKIQKAALKAQAAEMKKLEKEKQKWEKGKFAQKSIVAEIDNRIVELGSVGGQLLTRFAEKGLTYRIKNNPIERSVVWTMTIPEHISQLSSSGTGIPYVLFVYEAVEFCSLVINGTLMAHAYDVQRRYPSYTVCYLTNRLLAYINKREKEQYKNPANSNSWRRPPVEEALAKLTTHFSRVHSRQCVDEAEIAEHIVGLTCSLASCQFRKKLTRLSVNANGSLIPKDCVDKNLIKKNAWLKALVAIPKVQPRFAIAIWKKYPTMKSLLSVYMDPSKTVHEKEFLLKDLTVEGLVSGDRRLGEVCSKRVYRILMAQNGSTKTDEVEDGADFF